MPRTQTAVCGACEAYQADTPDRPSPSWRSKRSHVAEAERWTAIVWPHEEPRRRPKDGRPRVAKSTLRYSTCAQELNAPNRIDNVARRELRPVIQIVQTPFVRVAKSVVKTPCVRKLSSDWVRL